MESFDAIIYFSVIIFNILGILSLIANFVLFKRQKIAPPVLGLIPIVNLYILFKTFINKKIAIIFTIVYILSYLFGGGLLLIVLVFAVVLYANIAKAFDKNPLWVFFLLLCYPIAIFVLSNNEITQETVRSNIDDFNKKLSDRKKLVNQLPLSSRIFWGVIGVVFPILAAFFYVLYKDSRPEIVKAIVNGIWYFILFVILIIYALLFLATIF